VEIFGRVKRMLLGDDVGLGKTVQSMGHLLDSKNLPGIVVMPSHLQFQWAGMIQKFTNLTTHTIKGRKAYGLPEAEVYLLKYSCLQGDWINVFQDTPPKTLIMDEVQEIRRRESIKHQVCKKIADLSESVLGLTATPIYNYGMEIFNIYDVIKPDALGNEEAFRREWCGYGDRVGNPEALGSFLRSNHLFLRRTDDETPKENKIVHTVDFDREAIEKIQKRAEVLAQKVMGGKFVERGRAARDLDMMVRHATGVSKAKHVADYVKILLKNGDPVLLAGWHRDVYDIWLEQLKEFNPLMYTGTESQKKKDATKEAFIRGESNLMIISLRSGAGLDGLQYSKCKHVVIGELDWSPGIHKQLIGRLIRDGQDSQVTAIFLVSDSGSDPVITEILGIKASQAEGIVNPFASVAPKHSDDSKMKKLAELYYKQGTLFKEQV